MANTATFSGAMKTRFLGPIRDNLHSGKVLLYGSGEGGNDQKGNPTGFQGIKRSAEGIDFIGNEFRIPLKTARNQGVGFRSENEILPAPGAGAYTYLTEPMRYMYGLFNITGQLMKAATGSNEGAFVSAFKQEMEDTVLTAKIQLNRAAWGDGSGKMADVATTASGTTVIVSSTINFRGGEVIDFVAATGQPISAAHTVTGIDRATRTLTFTPTLAAGITATTHYIVQASSDSTTSVGNNSRGKEIQGMQSLVDSSGIVHGVNPTTYPFWKSYEDNVAAAPSDAKLRAALDGVGFESGADQSLGGSEYVMITTRGIRQRYADTLTSVKRFNDAQSTTLRGGFKVLMFDDAPIFVDDQCPVGHLFILDLKSFFWAQLSDWDWMDQDGEVLKWESRYDRYIAVLYAYIQLGTTARNRNAKLTALTDDVR